MFYSHEVLTSRKYGVATVWLVATLGSKSTLKKVSRKAILDVDVAKACETIGTPEAPLALRLQSNLLYGVTRVYAQQCGYVLNDAETAKQNMRMMFKVVQASTLDAEAGTKGRADQLMLQDDPNFLPDMNMMGMDLDRVDLDLASNEDPQRSTLSPHSSQLTGVGVGSQHEIGGLIIPQSASSLLGGPVGGFGSLSIRGDSGAGTRARATGFLDDDLGLETDQDGMVISDDRPIRQSSGPPAASERLDRGSAVSGLRGADAPGMDNNQEPLFGQPEDDGYMPLQDDFLDFGPAPGAVQPPQQSAIIQQTTSEETAEAPQHRQRRQPHKPIPLDRTMELRNSDLARWNNEYLANMKEAIRQKEASKSSQIAKKNAEKWMLGTGDLGPLSMFTGAKLLESLTGLKLTARCAKRPREEEDAAADSDRRVRSRGEPSSEEVCRGIQDDGFVPMLEDDTIEKGREAPTPLDDRQLSSIMPWNQSAGSRRPTALFSGANQPTSASFGGPAGMLARRGSRLTSASPLVGHGAAGGELDDVQLPGFQDDDMSMTGAEEFELFGPAAGVDTQTAAQSQWRRAVLHGESLHFLDFVQAEIEQQDETRAQAPAGDEEDETLRGTIDFDLLLPPETHTRIVAAQGLLHVLALGTKSLISVQQDEAYGPITIQVVAPA